MPDAELLEETSRALGAKTYPAAVNQALAEAIRIKKLGALRQFWGAESGLGNWPISNKITLALNNWERKAGGGDPGGYVPSGLEASGLPGDCRLHRFGGCRIRPVSLPDRLAPRSI